MGKFQEIVDTPWNQMTLYSESIPHLLHWDLAYLWVLEKQDAVRPERWKERIEAWKYLVTMLLMDRVRLTEVRIDEPLINYIEPFGLKSVFLLEIDGYRQPIGVLSPTVLARPLPDYRRGDLAAWRGLAEDPSLRDPQRVDHLLSLTAAELGKQHPTSFPGRLASCILNEFNPVPTGAAPNTKSVHFSFLNRVSWSEGVEDAKARPVVLPVFGQGHGDYWTPQCACGEWLTGSQNDRPIDVTENPITITCSKCRNPTDLNLSDFLVWLPPTTTKEPVAVLWKRDRVTSNPAKGFPPQPQVNGSVVKFRWQAGELGMRPDKQFLKLNFPNRRVLEMAVSELCYSKLLIAGSLAPEYAGLPFRSDWMLAISNFSKVRATVDTNVRTVTYEDVEIHGLPVPVAITYGPQRIKIAEDIAVGIYPDPGRMPSGWKAFRVFVAGKGREGHSVKSDRYNSVLPWLADCEDLPAPFSVESKNGDAGATFYIEPTERVPSDDEHTISVGIDFGTTNTLLYVAPLDFHGSKITPEVFAIRPFELRNSIKWLALDSRGDSHPTVDFLPDSAFQTLRMDEYLMPTAVWSSGQNVFIRWRSSFPEQSFQPDARFKSRSNAKLLRLRYLRELLFLTMPGIVVRGGDPNARIHLKLGFSFPLAFGYQERDEMKQTLGDLVATLSKNGIRCECFSLNESRASVRAFGTPSSNEHFLVADMGGGTLDLALFTTTEDEGRPVMHQIGSLRYAGEDYVESFASTESEKWNIRDAIAWGESSRAYGESAKAQAMLQRFLAFGFEYMRTMLESFRKSGNNDIVKIVLVGNGWHLADALSPVQRSRKEIFIAAYEHLVEQLGTSDIQLYFDDPLPALPSSKHLVVIGALRNAWRGEALLELESTDSAMSKLPAGRGMSLGVTGAQLRLQWYDLVGEGVPLNSFSESDLKAASAFYFDEMPPFGDSWKRFFLKLFRIDEVKDLPKLADAQIREQIYKSIGGMPPKIGKGPLQVILEESWKDKLRG